MSMAMLQQAAWKAAGGSVGLESSTPVVETFQGNVIWKGTVHIFKVLNPPPDKVYGWIVVAEGGPDYVTVLGVPPINSPLDAVRAWIVSNGKK